MLGQAPGFEVGESADRAQQMLVDRVVMIHVELHHRDDAAEIRNEAPEHAGLVHAPQDDLGHVARQQNFEKEPVRFLVGAQIGVDLAQRQRHGAHGVGMQRQAVVIGHPEQPDDIDGIALEKHWRRRR